MSEFITIKEAAKLVNKNETSIYRWAKKLPKNQVKNQRPFLVSKDVLFAHYNTQEKTQNWTQKTQKRKIDAELDNKLIINELEKKNDDNFARKNATLHAKLNAKLDAKLSDDDKAFFQAQIKAQNIMIQDLQNTNHNLLLLIGAKEKQVNNLLERVNLISSKFEKQESEVIEILAQYSLDIEEMKQSSIEKEKASKTALEEIKEMVEMQKNTSNEVNKEFRLMYFVGAVVLLISLVFVMVYFT
jgi:transposase